MLQATSGDDSIGGRGIWGRGRGFAESQIRGRRGRRGPHVHARGSSGRIRTKVNRYPRDWRGAIRWLPEKRVERWSWSDSRGHTSRTLYRREAIAIRRGGRGAGRLRALKHWRNRRVARRAKQRCRRKARALRGAGSPGRTQGRVRWRKAGDRRGNLRAGGGVEVV